jgi:hypothetical protein
MTRPDEGSGVSEVADRHPLDTQAQARYLDGNQRDHLYSSGIWTQPYENV